MNGSYDRETNTVYWGTGNPYPDYDGDYRRGDNLYSDSVIALDAETGRLKWHYQFTPFDWWDYDGVNEMLAREAFALAAAKLPIPTTFVARHLG
jgi:alcohol dehydrogenase (cytochrome c)